MRNDSSSESDVMSDSPLDQLVKEEEQKQLSLLCAFCKTLVSLQSLSKSEQETNKVVAQLLNKNKGKIPEFSENLKLEPKDRLILSLLYFEGYTMASIAEIETLQLNERQIRYRHKQAFKQIRKTLQAYGLSADDVSRLLN